MIRAPGADQQAGERPQTRLLDTLWIGGGAAALGLYLWQSWSQLQMLNDLPPAVNAAALVLPGMVLLLSPLLCPAIPSYALFFCMFQALYFYPLNLISPDGLRSGFLIVGLVSGSLAVLPSLLARSGMRRLAPRAAALAALVALLGCCEVTLRSVEDLEGALSYEKRASHDFWNLSNYTNLLGHFNGVRGHIFSGREFAKAKPDGVFRVLCLASSSTAGEGSSDSDRFAYPAALQKLLDRETPGRFEVINGSISGAPLFMLTIYLQEVLLRWQPDLVLLYFGANGDKVDARSYYRLMRQELAAAHSISTEAEMWAAVRLRWNPPWLIRAFLTLARSWIFMAAVNASDDLRVWLQPGTFPAEGFHRKETAADRTLFARSAGQVGETSLRAGAKVLLIPEVRLEDSGRSERPYYDGVYQRLARTHGPRGVAYRSLLGVFPEHVAARHMIDNVHMNDGGYRYLAERVFLVLRQVKLLP